MAAKWRARRWAGIDIGSRILQLWRYDADKTWIDEIEDRLIEGKTFFNIQNISAHTIKYYLTLYHRIKPDLIYGYAHSIYEFAYLIKESGQKVKHLPVAIITACEKLFDYQRCLIEKVFGSKVSDEYGSKEFHFIAAECPKGNMHIAQENLIVEFLNDGHPADEGKTADIIITDLTNYEMPLIRYKLGDRGSVKNAPCSCGRGLATMNINIGRDSDFIKLESGRNIDSGILAIPEDMPHYNEVGAFKVIQKSFANFQILLDTTDNARPHLDRKSTRLNSSHIPLSRMPSSA